MMEMASTVIDGLVRCAKKVRSGSWSAPSPATALG